MVSRQLTFRPAEADDVKAIVKLSDNNFGNVYLSEENVRQFIMYIDGLVYVAENDKVVIGFGIFHVIMQWELIYHLGNNLANKYEDFNPQDRIFLIKTLVIQPNFRGIGCGKKLVSQAMKDQYLGGQLLSIVWESKENKAMEKLCKALGMKFWFKAENFWFNDSSERNYNCPICGNPCRCSALIYKKTKMDLNTI